jgi:hypothetical protein
MKNYVVTVYLNLPDFGYSILQTLVSTDPSQGLYSGNRNRSA